MKIMSVGCVAAPALLAMLAGQAAAQCQFTNYSAGDRATGDGFGNALASGGQILAVGSWLDDNSEGADAGSVYVFTRNLFGGGFAQTQRLQDPSGGADQLFGRTVATDGTSLLVGAAAGPSSGFNVQGRARMFRIQANGFFQQETFNTPAGLDTGAEFGTALAVQGNIAVVGAYLQDGPSGADSGAAYIYRRVSGSWGTPVSVIEPINSSAAGDRLGQSVATDGSTVVVGVPYANVPQGAGAITDSGSVLVLTPSGNSWNLSATLSASTITQIADRRLGFAVAIDGNTIVAGAPGDNVGGLDNMGRIYIFTRENGQWTYQQRLAPTDGVAGDLFGVRVAISGNRILARSGSGADRAHLFKRSAAGTWYQDRILPASTYAGTTAFPSGIDIVGTQAFAGDTSTDYVGASNAGRALAIDLAGIGGDETAIADPVSVGGSYEGCTIGATSTGSFITPPCGSSAGSPDVWYAFTPAQGGRYVLDTVGSEFDTVLGVYTIPQQLPLLNQVACDDDGAGNNRSRIILNTVAGNTYYIRVSGFNFAAGRFTLNVNTFCPADLNFDGAVDFNDLLEYLNRYNAQLPSADLNEDGVVDFNDLLAFLNFYNTPC